MTDLRAYLRGLQTAPLRYGRHDCLIFVNGWVRIATTRDLLQGHSYSGLRDGLAQLRAHGLRDHVDLVARAFERVPVLQGVAGDIAVLPDRGLDVLTLVAPGGETLVGISKIGLVGVPLDRASQMFRVR